MTERPILFSGPMVRAILEGRKTQTRRVVKRNAAGRAERGGRNWHLDDPDAVKACPYGVPGDRLWVRETWRSVAERGRGGDIEQFMYRAGIDAATDGWKWKPGIHMPRRACRLVLEVTAVRVERLQEISQQDVFAEGLHNEQQNEYEKQVGRRLAAQDCYRYLWDSINAKRAPWVSNPWVWVVEFKRA